MKKVVYNGSKLHTHAVDYELACKGAQNASRENGLVIQYTKFSIVSLPKRQTVKPPMRFNWISYTQPLVIHH